MSRQSSATIATSAISTPAPEETIWVITEVTTACIEPMSEKMRDWISPVRVRVKNPRPMRCRCENTETRRSCITDWPTRVDSIDWVTPRALETTVTAISPPTAQPSTSARCSGRATSTISRIRNGETTPAAAPTTMSASTPARVAR